MRATYLALLAAVIVPVGPAAAQQELTGRGPIPHAAAGTTFPVAIGDFRRGRVVQFDAEGRDLSAGYELATPEGRITLTVYLYPPRDRGEADQAMKCRREFDANVQEISGVPLYTNMAQGAETRARTMPGTGPDLSHATSFRFRVRFDGQEQAVQSFYRLYCFVGGDWMVKFRATGPDGAAVEEAVDRFIPLSPWPGRAFPENSVQVSGASRSAR